MTAIDGFCGRRKLGRTGQALGIELIELRHACDRLELEFSGTAAHFAATSEYELEGSATPIDWDPAPLPDGRPRGGRACLCW